MENVLRQLKEVAAHPNKRPLTMGMIINLIEVRSAIVPTTVIVALNYCCRCSSYLPGGEGQLMQPLAVAHHIAVGVLVCNAVTPVMAYYLLPSIRGLDHGTPRCGRGSGRAMPGLTLCWPHRAAYLAAAGYPCCWRPQRAVFPTTFLPPFSEGVALVGHG
jgi:HME family heavy-metal exporter